MLNIENTWDRSRGRKIDGSKRESDMQLINPCIKIRSQINSSIILKHVKFILDDNVE